MKNCYTLNIFLNFNKFRLNLNNYFLNNNHQYYYKHEFIVFNILKYLNI